ncbi:hypothetical protein [Algoriphagus sp.]|jgi:hypothetical protein|uniref:hypothetical protein n=1 Tax=Algoriphagus sp. TaxID=1872435 RepID=UPI00257E9648|nr:hypothetical protein [Algoriphagus sp.]
MKKQLGKLLGGIFLCLLGFFVHDLSSSNGEELIFSKVIVSGFVSFPKNRTV